MASSISSLIPPALLQELAQGASDINLIRNFHISALAMLITDFFITFPSEVALFWGGRWTLPRVLFFINRYGPIAIAIFDVYGLLTAFSDGFCLVWIHWQGWVGTLFFALVQMILIIRLHALYNNRKLLILLISVWIMCWIASGTIQSVSIDNEHIVSQPIPGVNFCAPVQIDPNFYVFWIPPIIFELLAMILAFNKARVHFNSTHSRLGIGTRLIEVMVRDSMMYFLIIFVIELVDIFLWFQRPDLAELTLGHNNAFSSILGCRLLMNIRATNARLGREEGTDTAIDETGYYSQNKTATANATIGSIV